MSTVTILPAPGLLAPSAVPLTRVQGRAEADPITASARSSFAPFLHDTCPFCGFDGDIAVVLDPDQGLMGWSCPECREWVTTRDLVPDEREDMFA